MVVQGSQVNSNISYLSFPRTLPILTRCSTVSTDVQRSGASLSSEQQSVNFKTALAATEGQRIHPQCNWCLVITNASFRYFLRSRVAECFLRDQWWPFKLVSYMSTKNTVPKTIKQCASWFLNDCFCPGLTLKA